MDRNQRTALDSTSEVYSDPTLFPSSNFNGSSVSTLDNSFIFADANVANDFQYPDSGHTGLVDPSLLETPPFTPGINTDFGLSDSSLTHSSGYSTPTPGFQDNFSCFYPQTSASTPCLGEGFQGQKSVDASQKYEYNSIPPFRPGSAPIFDHYPHYDYPPPPGSVQNLMFLSAYSNPQLPKHFARMPYTCPPATSSSCPGSPNMPFNRPQWGYHPTHYFQHPRYWGHPIPIPRSTPGTDYETDEEPRRISKARKRTVKQKDDMMRAKRLKRLRAAASDDSDGEKQARKTPKTFSNSEEKILSIAYQSNVRRSRNPGRALTVEQTEKVQARNEKRRLRYRESLPPKKRALYDRNTAIAKGLLAEDNDGDDEED